MTCNICDKEIGFHQMRHSNGLGNYHILCEFDQTRRQLGMVPFSQIRHKHTSSSYKVTHTISSRNLKSDNQSSEPVLEIA